MVSYLIGSVPAGACSYRDLYAIRLLITLPILYGDRTGNHPGSFDPGDWTCYLCHPSLGTPILELSVPRALHHHFCGDARHGLADVLLEVVGL